MANEKILIVDDEEDVLELVRYNLDKNGYKVETAATGEQALAKAGAKLPDLIILDLMLPGIDGLDVCKKLKNDTKTQNIPVIMLTAKGEETDIVTGLELGADDYVTKPFSPKVLVARIRRVLQRPIARDLEKASVKIHQMAIDPSRRQVLIKNKPVELTFTEFNILYTLAKRPGIVFTRYQIVDSIHGEDYLVTDRAIDVQIVSLRKKLGEYEKYIETVRGVGYRFRD
ncbi:MAG TPA: DNA-binding response regulator [Phycisphaerales bacterium]|nr:MAG: DNA-binding response regulator [Planctomycetes bacterium GWC2_45_44]HBG78561.1 DNA-binding response regulator [Phycisphaerales bacterium]HBR20739.1 DNA-binding response regulator [Phycisphaerales bacterium]